MAVRPSFALVLVSAFLSLGAGYRVQSQNFLVEAPTQAIAQQIAQAAEHYRREKAVQWLGQEMPPWPVPCPVHVSVTNNGSGGATSFAFDQGRILETKMHIEGTLDRLLASVLPHEVTHTVFAHRFRCPLPRWADEGGAVLSEDDIERYRHDKLVRQILNTPGRAIPLRRLFSLTNYPLDVMVLYAEGFSVAEYLVNKSSRDQFLAFIAYGMRYGWDPAVHAYFNFNSVEQLEQAWLANLQATKRAPGTMLASARPQDDSGRIVVRQTVPPAQPLPELVRPVFRAQAETEDSFGLHEQGRPTHLPDAGAASGWRQQPAGPSGPPAVRLGAPQFDPIRQPVQVGQPIYGPSSPVGYSQ